MQSSFVISIPANDAERREEIEQHLSAYANVQDVPRAFGLEEIKMIVEIIAGASSILVNGTAIIAFLLMLKDRFKKTGKPSGIRIAVPGQNGVALDEIDEAILKRMMGMEEK